MSTRARPGGTPQRLLHAGGDWVLEVLRHVNITPDLVRPTTERVCGSRSITAYFKHNPSLDQLGHSALKLLRTEDAAQSSYTALGDEWVPSSLPPPREAAGERSAISHATQLQLARLEAQLIALIAVQEGLAARLARLESGLATNLLSAASPLQGTAAKAAVPAPASQARAPQPTRTPRNTKTKAPKSRGGAPAPAAPPAEVEAAPIAASAPPAASDAAPVNPLPMQPRLTLPDAEEFSQCVGLLIGTGVSAHEADVWVIGKTTRDCYAAPLLDDGGEEVGMVLMDLRATVYLGGTLMMLPQSQLEQQVKSALPVEDSIAASAEVCNAMTGPINASQSACHVRVGPLEKFEFRSASWVAEPVARRDLEDSFGGRIAILCRQ